MKKFILIILSGFLLSQANAQFGKGSLQATGLTCALCSNAINKALQKLPFVSSVRSDIKNSSFSIIFKTDVPVNIDGIKNAVEDAGFSVGSLKLTGNFNDMKIANEKHVKIGNDNFHFLNVPSETLTGEYTI